MKQSIYQYIILAGILGVLVLPMQAVLAQPTATSEAPASSELGISETVTQARELGLKIGNQAPAFLRNWVDTLETWRARMWVSFARKQADTRVALVGQEEKTGEATSEARRSTGTQLAHVWHTIAYEVFRSALLFYALAILLVILIIRWIFGRF